MTIYRGCVPTPAQPLASKSLPDNRFTTPTMTIRKTLTTDIPAVCAVFDKAKAFMRTTGNLHQWTGGYPSESQLLADIQAGGSHVLVNDDGRVVGTFFFTTKPDPTYAVIKEGEWLDDSPYGVIHRIASDGTVKGVLCIVLDHCFGLVDNIRIDTHRDNKVMQKGLTAYGFTYRGIINLASGDERLAYQYLRRPSN